MDLMTARKKLNRYLSQYQLARKTVQQEKLALSEAEESVGVLSDALDLVQKIGASIQESAHKQIASIVTRCLATVFGEEAYEFVILFEKKRNKTDAVLALQRDGQVYRDPKRQVGGGVVDLASFALRLVCMLLAKPHVRRLLVLDEPFRFLSAEYRPAVRVLLEQLAEELGVQIIMSTHSPELQVGKVIEIE